MKKISFLFIIATTLLFSNKVVSQENNIDRVNYFKYVVIPVQYKFQDEENKYMLNSLTKHLFNEEGFETYMNVETKPKDLAFNKCLALYAEVQSESESFFSLNTQLKLILRDCNDQIVFKSEGRSKLKNYKEAYHDALKNAFKVFNTFNYSYNGKNSYDQKISYLESETSTVENSNKINTQKPTLEEELNTTLPGTYSLFNENYSIRKIEAGFILTNNSTGNKKAFINITSNNSILFNSESINGTLSINDDHDLEIEYFNKKSSKLEKVTLYRID
ncbi:hypothetical protein [Mesonia aestuariivivens]|uniref:Uncharacterized protein n=1 Tax=Mesonia aestuariivivens TaxID=2796128 RepID=A0ABS6W420_9FLAO|nr:hypothetical protein [Mesonia aestuariivivens]MBW2962231.1 hypothetical protein [Mesonia aestuariivivens]